jgi:hypothetical protein
MVSMALCPVCDGVGHLQVASGDWGICPVCQELGLVPEPMRTAVAALPCEGCLGRGASLGGELCPLCEGLGLLLIDLSPVGGEKEAA